jgi:MYXO-CTERM domain-containing protein
MGHPVKLVHVCSKLPAVGKGTGCAGFEQPLALAITRAYRRRLSLVPSVDPEAKKATGFWLAQLPEPFCGANARKTSGRLHASVELNIPPKLNPPAKIRDLSIQSPSVRALPGGTSNLATSATGGAGVIPVGSGVVGGASVTYGSKSTNGSVDDVQSSDGCSCRLDGRGAPTSLSVAAVLGLGLLVRRRRNEARR